MKKLTVLLVLIVMSYTINAQGLKNILKKVQSKDSSGNSKIFKTNRTVKGFSSEEIANGLREALQVGAEKSTSKLSVADGFFGNALIKILLPAEAKNVETKLRAIGLSSQVDQAILSMNRAAEQASSKALPIFLNVIRGISINDAAGILAGHDSSATIYLKSKTSLELTNAFRPVIEAALASTNATKYWNTLFSSYNKISLKKINPDLTSYVTESALNGLFFQIGKEEQQIRQNPIARTSDLLKKIFAK